MCVCAVTIIPSTEGVQGPGSSSAPSTPLIDITRIPFLQSYCLPNRHTGRRVVRLGKDHLVPLQTESRALWFFFFFKDMRYYGAYFSRSAKTTYFGQCGKRSV